MKNKKILITIFIAGLILILPITNVVGIYKKEIENQEEIISSPLFKNRISKAINKDTKKMSNKYLGETRIINLFSKQKTSLNLWIDKAVKLIEVNPGILISVLNKLLRNPKFLELINEFGINKKRIENEIVSISNNPNKLKNKANHILQLFEEKQIILPDFEPPSPLGFSGQMGCILTFFLVVLPIIMMIGGFVSAIVAIIVPGTFLVPGCLEWVFEKVFSAIAEGFQNLSPP
jgi:hypothetical protein